MVEVNWTTSKPVCAWPVHDGPVVALDASPSLPVLATAEDTGRIKLWRLKKAPVIADQNARPITAAFLEAYHPIDPMTPENGFRITDGKRWYDLETIGEDDLEEDAPPWAQIAKLTSLWSLDAEALNEQAETDPFARTVQSLKNQAGRANASDKPHRDGRRSRFGVMAIPVTAVNVWEKRTPRLRSAGSRRGSRPAARGCRAARTSGGRSPSRSGRPARRSHRGYLPVLGPIGQECPVELGHDHVLGRRHPDLSIQQADLLSPPEPLLIVRVVVEEKELDLERRPDHFGDVPARHRHGLEAHLGIDADRRSEPPRQLPDGLLAQLDHEIGILRGAWDSVGIAGVSSRPACTGFRSASSASITLRTASLLVMVEDPSRRSQGKSVTKQILDSWLRPPRDSDGGFRRHPISQTTSNSSATSQELLLDRRPPGAEHALPVDVIGQLLGRIP